MAYLVDYTVQESTAGATSVAVTLPTHEVNDILVVFITQDATATISMTGWTQIGTTQTANSAVVSAMFWKRAASTAETGTLTISVADAYTIKSLVIRDVDTTTAIDVSSTTNSGTTSVSQFTSPSVTTTVADCFVLYAHGIDGIATAVHSDPGIHFIQSSDSTGTTATTSAASGMGWYIQRAAGTTPTPSWTCSLAGVRTNFVIAFRNVSGGKVPAYIDDIDKPKLLVGGHHFSTLNGISFPAALTLANIGPGGTGKTTLYDAAAATADYGINPYSSALATTPATQAATGTAGFEVTFSPTIDMSTGFVMGTVIAANPKMANYNHGSVTEGGSYVVFGSSGTNTNYRSYQVIARDSKPNTEGRAVWSIKPSQTATAFGTNGTMVTTAISKMLFLSNCPTATITLYCSDWVLIQKIVAAGGTSASPVDTEGLYQVGASFRIPAFTKTGAAGLLAYVPIQIGGGDAINFQIDAGALIFPRAYNTTTKEINFHADANAIGISYAGKSGDVIKHTNSVVTSPSSYYWEINSAATNAATWDFSGLSIVGATVTLRNVTTFSSMTFAACGSINASGCTIVDSTITGSTVANSLTVSGTTSISNSTINTTSLAAGSGLVSTGTPSVFSDCSFIGSSTSGHAIVITTPGTYTFSGLTFTGYGGTGGTNSTPSSGSTSAAIYNNSGGAVTINVSGGGSSPSVRNGASATTTVSAAANVTLTGLKTNSEVRAYLGTNPATSTEIDGIESSGTSFTFSQSVSGQSGYIVVLNNSYQPIWLDIVYSGSDVSIPIQQITDRQYLNP